MFFQVLVNILQVNMTASLELKMFFLPLPKIKMFEGLGGYRINITKRSSKKYNRQLQTKKIDFW